MTALWVLAVIWLAAIVGTLIQRLRLLDRRRWALEEANDEAFRRAISGTLPASVLGFPVVVSPIVPRGVAYLVDDVPLSLPGPLWSDPAADPVGDLLRARSLMYPTPNRPSMMIVGGL